MVAVTEEGRIACRLHYNQEIAPQIFDMLLEYPLSLPLPAAGQFVNLYCHHQGRLLPRPISVCEVMQKESGSPPLLRLVYAVQGEGTLEFSTYQPGQFVDILGPFGNGFSLPDITENSELGRMLLIGGGVGTPPMVELAKQLTRRGLTPEIVVGFRHDTYLLDTLERYGRLHIATESGICGYCGNVVDLIVEEKIAAQQIFACGPTAMLRGVQQLAATMRVASQLSLEERMGCGFGGCVGCVTRIAAKNDAGFIYKKVCKDGPVFAGQEVLFQ